ncbi:MAG: DnaJ domain-containing protein [Cyanobacteria bacterium P01_A01_bin.45]
MAEDYNHYQTLNLTPNASQVEIKQAYRSLVKQYHPDSNQDTIDNEQIIRINAAYEVLGDKDKRYLYDQQLRAKGNHYSYSDYGNTEQRQKRTTAAQKEYKAKRKTQKNKDELIQEWLRFVYRPVSSIVENIMYSLRSQIEELAADPFDDELLEEFQEYLDTCKINLKQAQSTFRSLPNPPSLASAAAHLYYCLDRITDGLGELEYFPLNYDESYLHAGQEMFRIASSLYYEAQDSVSRYG